MKKLILVTGPAACGKTFVSKQLAKALRHVVYLDKDTLIVLSKQIFKVANQPYDRSSAFFNENIRDYEYQAILNLALDALDYDDMALINAPFTQEIRDPATMDGLRARLAPKGARLAVVWLVVQPQVCRQRMERRSSDRDTWKLANWDEYLKTTSFEVPKSIDDPTQENDLLLFYNSNAQQFEESMKRVVAQLESDD